MLNFSQRNGHQTIPANMKPKQMTEGLRNKLWNVVDSSVEVNHLPKLMFLMWHDFFKKPTDTIPARNGYMGDMNYAPAWAAVRQSFFASTWHQTFDFIEFFLKNKVCSETNINRVLEDELAAYRVVAGQVTQVTETGELAEVERAINDRGPYSPASEHIEAALLHLSNRNTPDYRNSIKESISAVESMAKLVAQDEKATLGKALNKLEKDGRLAPALKNGFNALYGWTSDAEGIRHGMNGPASVGADDAKFFLIACSAFVNYLKSI
ncbi:hypothetical protein RBA41_22655 [Massilia sp. CCM 9210]|uniref:AbiJ-NTD4 domain-containing protein n=1 Tax=Massilia scottii TaxID=3057166 RepID=UPI002796A151|nr:hypothetical protein [Massilia sp. CCM 9210]MDQ1816102.1 hypothetical protein [Massilia sp. CCM 9210]